MDKKTIEGMQESIRFNVSKLKNERVDGALGDENYMLDKAIRAFEMASNSLDDYWAEGEQCV